MIILAVCAVLLAAMAWKMRKLKKEIYRFADQLEECLDDMISGKQLPAAGQDEDTLWGKIYEKLWRADHIRQKKEEDRKSTRLNSSHMA